ncbi:hypothetical protein IMX26_15995 [Clostridium sp. 'deep sea']|uniref:alpha/beta hydrolase n=1 Tax=Clostridium sp. 'deep sea' TaxID=2779445 RepID=UPI00189671CC|nr:hypothetical protein [Clostridium sp. 'deep sea']QOR34940.1 hypothetical protein IMX26_15995 [Clostridium sp. 'deep sea']
MFGNLKELPIPNGKYNVGITQIDFVDKSRKTVFGFKNEGVRKIPVKFFYPADSIKGNTSAPYTFPEAIEPLKKMTLGLLSKKITKTKTHCYKNVAVSNKQKNFPVVFYNHGYSSYAMQDTTLCSNLASSGFIVVSLAHPYESSALKYLDGSIIKIHKSHLKNLTKSPKGYKKYIKSVFKKNCTYSNKEAMEIAEVLFKKYNCKLSNHVKIWVDDSIFIANELEKLNTGIIESVFKNKLKLNLGFAITGQSFGGSVAAQTCLVDNRFKCGINIDGGTYGDYLYKDLKKPFMVIGTNIMRDTSRTTYIYNSEDSYMVLISDTAHYGFSDALFTCRQLNILNVLGKRDKFEFHNIYSQYHLNFFKKYLLKNNTVNLNNLNYKGVEFYYKKNSKI